MNRTYTSVNLQRRTIAVVNLYTVKFFQPFGVKNMYTYSLNNVTVNVHLSVSIYFRGIRAFTSTLESKHLTEILLLFLNKN